MARERRKRKPDATITVLRPGPDQSALSWGAFSNEHADWLRQFDASQPLYHLPEEALDVLGRADRGNRPVIDPSSAEAEDALTALCRQSYAVGFWGWRSIQYHYFCPSPPLPNLGELKKLGFAPGQVFSVQSATAQTPSAVERLKGYVGWLLTEPAFLSEAAAIAARWHALSDQERPKFPFQRPFPLSEAPVGGRAGEYARSQLRRRLHQVL